MDSKNIVVTVTVEHEQGGSLDVCVHPSVTKSDLEIMFYGLQNNLEYLKKEALKEVKKNENSH
jgi:hypothetical protein